MSGARPILFSAPMVRAILEGRKSQTRRLVRDAAVAVPDGDHEHIFTAADPVFGEEATRHLRCPYGAPGDRLWVKEAIRRDGAWSVYDADGALTAADAWPWQRNRLPGMFCPRGLSRLLLEVTAVRVERLQDISEEDARAEGLPLPEDVPCRITRDGVTEMGTARFFSPLAGFVNLWDSINAKRAPWDSNPWCWVVEFKRNLPQEGDDGE